MGVQTRLHAYASLFQCACMLSVRVMSHLCCLRANANMYVSVCDQVMSTDSGCHIKHGCGVAMFICCLKLLTNCCSQ